MRTDREYLLGSREEELARLGLQHRLWAETAHASWARAGFGAGNRLLDLGCGPGEATVDLARLVGPSGTVVAADRSERFIAVVRERSATLDLAQVEALRCDGAEVPLEPRSLDGAFARWLFCFLPEPERVMARVAQLLKPGSPFVVFDYFSYETIRIGPACPEFDPVRRAVMESWRASGGDLDVMARMGSMMRTAGFDVEHMEPVLRVARPGSQLWQWPSSFFANYLPQLEREGFLSEEQRGAFEGAWARASQDPDAFVLTPPMMTVIGRKR